MRDLTDLEHKTLAGVKYLLETCGVCKYRELARITGVTLNASYTAIKQLKRKRIVADNESRRTTFRCYQTIRLVNPDPDVSQAIVLTPSKRHQRSPSSIAKRREYAAMYTISHREQRRASQKRHRATHDKPKPNCSTFITQEEIDAIVSEE